MIEIKTSIKTVVKASRLYRDSLKISAGRAIINYAGEEYALAENCDLRGTKYVQVGGDAHAWYFEATTVHPDELLSTGKRGEVRLAILKETA